MAKQTCWPPYQIDQLRRGLDELADVVCKLKGDEEILPWLTRMLVVRSSGFVEQTAKEAFSGYVLERSGGLVKSFGLSWLERSRNPSPDNLADMIGRFDSNLRNEFDAFLDEDDQQLRRELAYLVDRRNKIAHGLNESINRDKALGLKSVAFNISDWLVLKFNPIRQ